MLNLSKCTPLHSISGNSLQKTQVTKYIYSSTARAQVWGALFEYFHFYPTLYFYFTTFRREIFTPLYLTDLVTCYFTDYTTV